MDVAWLSCWLTWPNSTLFPLSPFSLNPSWAPSYCLFSDLNRLPGCFPGRAWSQTYLYLPAAKWSGVDLRPAMSFAFTLAESTSLFTRDTSPFLQASNSSLKAPLVPQTLSPGLALPESGVEPALLPPPVVDELALLELELLLLVLRSRAGVSAAISGSPMLSGSPPAAEPPVSVGDSGGVRGLGSGLGGEDKFCCCCCCCWEVRRDVAIFALKSPSGSENSQGELPGSVRVKLPFANDQNAQIIFFAVSKKN